MAKKKSDHWSDCIDAMLKRLEDHRLTAKLKTSRELWVFVLYKNELRKMKAELWEDAKKSKQ